MSPRSCLLVWGYFVKLTEFGVQYVLSLYKELKKYIYMWTGPDFQLYDQIKTVSRKFDLCVDERQHCTEKISST